jgi:glycosyltransferase involved in cell wall biosynthesis
VRVAIIAPPWIPTPPPAYGGTEAVLDGLTTGLARAGHDVLFVGHPDSTVPAEIVSPLGASLSGEIGHGVTELRHVLGGYEEAERWRADVVHDHTMSGPLIAESWCDVPVVVTNHGSFDDLTLPIFRSMPSASIVAISRSQASTAGDLPIAAVVHHGLDVESWPAGRGDGGYALFLGRMHPDKGPQTAIRLAAKAGIPIVLAAKMREGAEKAFFDAEVRPLLGPNATYVGEAEARTKKELLAGACCLLNPIAWMEPFGMVMIEAMACGTPVVGSAIGSASEIVTDGETGFLCNTEDQFLSGLASLDQIDRAQCRETVVQRFSIEAMTEQYVRVYERAIEDRSMITHDEHRRRSSVSSA